MRNLGIAILCMAACCCVRADPATPINALSTVSDYSRAVMTADCRTISRLSGVIARHPEGREPLCQAYADWNRLGLIERLREPILSLSSQNDRLVVIPNSRIGLLNGKPQIANGVYVAYSNDNGAQWKVIDVACDNLKDWIKGVYPAYKGPAFSASVDFPKNTH